MDPAVIGLLITVVTIGVFALGIPVAFGLGFVAVTFLLLFEGIGMSKVIADTFMEGLMEFTIVSIPMFIVMGMAVASSPAGKDLYSALDRWLNRVPGGLVVSNLGACALFAALSGSSPATCAAIGKMGIPEMRQRGYSKEISSGDNCSWRNFRNTNTTKYHNDCFWNFNRNFYRSIIYGRNFTRYHAYWFIYDVGHF